MSLTIVVTHYHGLQLEGESCLSEVGGDDDLLLLMFESEGDLRDKGSRCFALFKLRSCATWFSFSLIRSKGFSRIEAGDNDLW